MSRVSETQAGRQSPGWRPLKWKVALTSHPHPHPTPTSGFFTGELSWPEPARNAQVRVQGGNVRKGLEMGQEESQGSDERYF